MSRNPLGDTTQGAGDDRNTVGGGTSGGDTSDGGGTDGVSGGPGGPGDRSPTGGSDDDDDDGGGSRNPLGDTTRGADDDRQQTTGGSGGGGGSPEPPTTDLGDVGSGAVAAGFAGVAAPEPVSSGAGAVLATLGAGALAIDAARRSEISLPDRSDITGTRSEVDVPDRPQQSIQNEINAPRRRQTQTEISVPSRREDVTTTELGVPDRPQRDVGEIETPTATGVLQRQREQEDDTVEIGGDDIVIPDEPERNPPSMRERRQRDDLRDFRNRLREDGVTEGVVTEGVVGLGDTVTQTDTVDATTEPTLDPDVQTEFDTTTDTGSGGLDPVPPGADQDDRRQTVPFNPVDDGAGGGLGAEPATGDNATTGAGTGDTTGLGGGTSTGTLEDQVEMELIRAETDVAGALDTAQATQAATDTALETATETPTEQTTVEEALTEPAAPETLFETATPEVALTEAAAEATGETRDSEFRFPFGDGDDADRLGAGVQTDAEVFGSGVLSAEQAADDVFGGGDGFRL